MTTATGSGQERTDETGSRPLGVVVAYDGSPQSKGAVRWAGLEAARRGRPLQVVHVVDFSGAAVDVLAAQAGDWREPALEAGRTVADEGLALARQVAPGVPGLAIADIGAPIDVLVEASRHADVVVVGTRGRGDFSAAWLGSVSTAVAAHAFSPVVIVRDEHPPAAGPSSPVVVGVDGSSASGRAADIAAATAAETGAPLDVVSVWTGLSRDGRMTALASGMSTSSDVFTPAARARAEQVADRAVARVRETHPELDVRRVVVEGHPARALAEAAEGAALLVVGSRGRGAFTGLVLGSVSHGVAHRAACPVMVVRAPKAPRAHEHEGSEPVHIMI
jgi:nucleotide-binding universal stress UspA family protein